MNSPRVLDLAFDELASVLAHAPRYRARQVWEGIYKQFASSYSEISTLPSDLRLQLSRELPFTVLEDEDRAVSQDGQTTKTLHRLEDGQTIESVCMLYRSRATVCVSSQVGCAIGCPFCATGDAGFVRDLSTGEIVAQVLCAARRLSKIDRVLSNVVYMGMGEPFFNYDAVLSSVRILNDSHGFNLGARSYTISTAGVVGGIDRLSGEGIQVNLAVSLHAIENTLRDRLVPLNRQFPVQDVLAACQRYIDRTNRRVTFEVALMRDVNDSVGQAVSLARGLAGMLCHVNLIHYNPTGNPELAASSTERMDAFAAALEERGIPISIRDSKGTDIQAACGQLRAKNGPGIEKGAGA